MRRAAPASMPFLWLSGLLLMLTACAADDRERAAAMQALQERKQELESAFVPCPRDSGTVLPALVAESRCLVHEVPENPADPAGRRIPLQVMVVPAIRPLAEADPFVILVGGPGQAATRDAMQLVPAFANIRRNRDILLVDQRGTGALSPFADCEFEEEGALPTSTELLLEMQTRQLRDCLDRADADARYYTTDIAVQDLESIRQRLGYGALNLWGVSYGTRVALAYLKYFPASTRTVVLDGVAPPGVLPLEAARDGRKALDTVFAQCAAEAACAAAFPQLEAHYAELLERYRDAVPVDVRDPGDGGLDTIELRAVAIEGLLMQLLYSRETARLIPLAIEELHRGDFAILGWLAGIRADIDVAMHHAVICSEDLPRIVPEELAASSGIFGYDMLVRPRVEGCRVWPTRELDPAFFAPVVSDKPVLIFSATQDPVTPRRWGDQVAGTLSNSRHVVAEGVGHGVFAYGCAIALVGELVASAAVDGLDTACIGELGPRPFFTGWSGAGDD